MAKSEIRQIDTKIAKLRKLRDAWEVIVAAAEDAPEQAVEVSLSLPLEPTPAGTPTLERQRVDAAGIQTNCVA